MSAAKVLHERAQAIVNALDGPQDAEAVEALTEELAEISNALQKDGGAIDDPRSALEIAMDLDDAEVMATRASDTPR